MATIEPIIEQLKRFPSDPTPQQLKEFPSNLRAVIGEAAPEHLSDLEFVRAMIADVEREPPAAIGTRLYWLARLSSNMHQLKLICVRHGIAIEPVNQFARIVVLERGMQGAPITWPNHLSAEYLTKLKGASALLEQQRKADPRVGLPDRAVLEFLNWLNQSVLPMVESRQPPGGSGSIGIERSQRADNRHRMPGEINELVRDELKQNRNASARSIAKKLGVSHTTVRKTSAFKAVNERRNANKKPKVQRYRDDAELDKLVNEQSEDQKSEGYSRRSSI